MCMWTRIIFFCFLAAVCGWRNQATAQTGTPSKELLDVDRAFARATSDRGLEGWMSYLSDTVVISLSEPMQPVGGTENVRKHFASLFAIPGFTMKWEPDSAYIFSSGITGYTTGRYTIVTPNSLCRCTNTEYGSYVSVWRRPEGGEWKVKAFIPSLEGGMGCGCSRD